MPKTGLQMSIPDLIFVQASCVPEEVFGRCAGCGGMLVPKRPILGSRQKNRITRACVQHKHLVHKRVGVHQRSLALGILVGLSKETRQMEVLEYVAQVNDIQPQSLAVAVNEALQEEEEVPGAERWPRSSCW